MYINIYVKINKAEYIYIYIYILCNANKNNTAKDVYICTYINSIHTYVCIHT